MHLSHAFSQPQIWRSACGCSARWAAGILWGYDPVESGAKAHHEKGRHVLLHEHHKRGELSIRRSRESKQSVRSSTKGRWGVCTRVHDNREIAFIISFVSKRADEHVLWPSLRYRESRMPSFNENRRQTKSHVQFKQIICSEMRKVFNFLSFVLGVHPQQLLFDVFIHLVSVKNKKRKDKSFIPWKELLLNVWPTLFFYARWWLSFSNK